MIPNTDPSMVTPQPNRTYPLARLTSSTYAAPLSYNQPTELLGGYDAKVNPMTGEEVPQTNFARGGHIPSHSGLASLVQSRGRGDDKVLVHMTPKEVQGLQALAMAHGGSLTINPETGLPEAGFLKNLLPTIIGATLNTFAPNVGRFVGNLIPGGLSEAAAQTIGTGLVVGGAYGLLEGDLKKGLAAGLGAYSGANIAQSLKAASIAAEPAKLSAEQVAQIRQANATENAARNLVGATDIAPLQAMPVDKNLQASSLVAPRATTSYFAPVGPDLQVNRPATTSYFDQISRRMPSVDLSTGPVATTAAQPSIMGGIRSLYSSPQARTAFMQGLGGGFESPFMQNIAKTATFSGLANAFQPEPAKFPGAGGAGEDYVYIPGGFNPLYGTGRDQPYQLPGKYYKRTPQGLVPFNPFALAPGGRAAGGEIQSYADGGVVDPSMDPGGSMMLQPLASSQYTPYFTNPVTDPNVAATRSYIEELNRRARNPVVTAYPGGAGLGGTNQPYVPGAGGGGGGGAGAGGVDSLTGSPVGDLAVSLVAGHYLNQGIGAGVNAIKGAYTDYKNEKELQKDVEAEAAANPELHSPAAVAAANAALAGLPVDSPFRPPSGKVTAEQTPEQIAATEAGGPQPTATTNVAPAVASVLPSVVSPYAPELPAGTVTPEAVGDISAPSSTGAASIAPAAISAGLGALAPARAGQVLIEGIDTVGGAAGAAGGAGAAGAAGEAGAGATGAGAASKIIPGLQAALGLQQAYQGIAKGKAGQAALGAYGASAGLGQLLGFAGAGPIGIGAAALAALASTLTTTEERGANEFKSYWKGVEQAAQNGATYFGQTDPKDLTLAFINLFRTNKFDFPGQEKYGRTGNDDFLRDMTNVINDAVKSGKVDPTADAKSIYSSVVQPWLDNMGSGTQDPKTQAVIDYMMTDLIHNFMHGRPVSGTQIINPNFPSWQYDLTKGNFPLYAGTPAELGKYAFFDQLITAPELQWGGVRDSGGAFGILAPPAAAAATRAAQLQQATGPTMRAQPVTQREMTDITAPPPVVQPPVNPFVEPEREYIQPIFTDGEEEMPRGRGKGFNYGGAVGEDYNFGFAGGGMPGEYAAGGKLLDGPGDGMSDDIPAVIRGKGVQRAALADGEFVIPADVVSHLGNGSTKAGARRLYDMMAQVRKARTGRTRQAPAVKTDRLLPA